MMPDSPNESLPEPMAVRIGGRSYTVEFLEMGDDEAVVLVDGHEVRVSLSSLPSSLALDRPEAADDDEALPPPVRIVQAPLPGNIVSVAVTEGQQITRGTSVCVLEAMKMHQNLRSDWDGTVTAIFVMSGQHVGRGEALVEITL
jgi:biotin carboxyl carrier protein